jgi:hypothetical protein
MAIAGCALLAAAALLIGCGTGSGPATEPAAAMRVPPLKARVVSVEHLRRAVLQGIGRDYLGGTQVGPPSFGLCLQRGMRGLLDEGTLRTLALVYRRPAGQQYTAQALADLAVPIGERCGGRRFVPMPIEASIAFRAGHLPPAGIGARLAHGPYLGVACLRASSIRCDRVGIDLVLRRDATAVTARVGGRRLELHTPGRDNGVAGREWVGYIDRAGLRRPGGPLHVDATGDRREIWGGFPPVYAPVRLEISYPRGRRVEGTLPRVSLSPDWGSSPGAFASERFAFEGSLPPGWRRSGARLVPLLLPREVLSVGTFPMPPGGGGNCGREPVVAIRRMRPGDALISIQEYGVTPRMRGHLTRSFPPKGRQLGLDGLRFGRIAAVADHPDDAGVPVTWGTVPFSESGRAFDALVYFRGRPGEGLRRLATRVLADLRFGPRTGRTA